MPGKSTNKRTDIMKKVHFFFLFSPWCYFTFNSQFLFTLTQRLKSIVVGCSYLAGKRLGEVKGCKFTFRITVQCFSPRSSTCLYDCSKAATKDFPKFLINQHTSSNYSILYLLGSQRPYRVERPVPYMIAEVKQR